MYPPFSGPTSTRGGDGWNPQLDGDSRQPTAARRDDESALPPRSSVVEDTVLRPAAADDPHDDDTILRAPRAVPDDTILRARRAVPDDDTVLRRPPAPAGPAPAETAPLYRLRLADGRELVVDRPTYLGRDPRPPRIPDRVPPQLIRLASQNGQVSRTHLQVRAEGRMVVVTDLGSTNGTTVTVPGQRPTRLRPGESLVLTIGCRVDLGDGNTVEVLPPAHRSRNTS